MLLAHAQPAALVAVIATEVARAVSEARGLVVMVLQVCVLTVAGLAFAADFYHQHRLCARCCAATPLDGPAVAQRRQRWLWLYHWAAGRWVYGVTFIAAAVAVGLDVPRWASVYPLDPLWVLVAYASLRHRPLQPWCPQCRYWGWDDDESDPAPLSSGDDQSSLSVARAYELGASAPWHDDRSPR